MASNTPKKSRSSEAAALQRLSNGLGIHSQTLPHAVIGGVTMATADLQSRLQVRIEQGKAVEVARAAWQNAVKTDRQARTQAKTFVSSLKQTVLAAFVGQIDALADFGLSPRKAVVVSPDTKVAAALKAKATRAARHTMGPKQKASIKGAVVVTPATATPVADATGAVTPPGPAPSPD
jgi:hypothetical protein